MVFQDTGHHVVVQFSIFASLSLRLVGTSCSTFLRGKLLLEEEV